MNQNLLTCPKCGQGGFLNVKSHRCKAVATIDGKAELVSSTDLKAIAKEINDGWRDTQAMFRKAIERAVYYGSLLLDVKKRLPHGQFGEWIKTECPQIPDRTTRQWMVLAQEAVNAMPQIKDIDIPAHQLLIAAPETLTDEQRTVQGDFFALLDGTTKTELLWGFKSPKTHHPIKPDLARRQAEEEDALANLSIEDLIGNIKECRLESNLLHATDDQLRRMERELITSLEHIRSFTRNQRD